MIKYSKNSIFKIPFETDPVGAYVTIKAVPEKEGGKDAVVVSTKDCTDSEIAVKVKSCGTEYLELRDYKGDLLKKITVYVYKPLSVLKFRYVDYAVARGDWTCTFKLITKPAKANEKIELVYDDELVTITEIGYGEYKAELLKDTKVTITAVTKSGLEATTELVPVDPGNDDDDDDDNTEDDYTEDNLED